MSIRYFAEVLRAIPLLPLLYFQGKRVRKNIPSLPAAKGSSGKILLEGKDGLTLLTIGESTMAGVGVNSHTQGFTGILAEELSKKLNQSILWRVYAESGFTAEKVSKEITPKIEEHKVDMIIIGLGGNDAFSLHSPGKWKSDIRNLLGELRYKFPMTPIFFAHLPPIRIFPAFTPLMQSIIGGLVELLGRELGRTIQNFHEVYYPNEVINLDDWAKKYVINDDISVFFSDGVHPSALTYELWGKEMASFVGNILKEKYL